MANSGIECFKNQATEFLENEINVNNRTIQTLGAIGVASVLISGDSSSKLLNKPFRGIAKSIQTHINDLESLTKNLSSSIGDNVKSSLNDIIGFFKRGPDPVSDLMGSSFQGLLSIFASNPAFAYGSSKRASKYVSKQAKDRIAVSNEIINLINKIRQVRAVLITQPGAFSTEPRDAAALSRDDLTVAEGIIQIVSSNLEKNPADRKLFTYDRALEKISEAIDYLKIGVSNFKLAEYMKLRLDLKVAIEKFVKFDLDIDLGIKNFGRTEQDFINNQHKVGTIESSYIRELLAKLKALIDNMNAVLAKESDELTLDSFLVWTQEAVNIYTLAHEVFDREIQNAINNQDNKDKQAYTSTKIVYEGVDSKAEESFLASLKSLPDLYFQYLRRRFTEDYVRGVEDSVKSSLATISQADQTIISTDSNFNPTEIIILGTLLSFAERAGLDVLANSIITGDLGGILGSLTNSSGSRAAQAASCLGSGIELVPSLETRAQLQNINSTIQGIHLNRQLAGETRENAFRKAKDNLTSQNQSMTRQKEKLASIKV